MQKIDFTNYKFHCSSLGKLMTNPRSKKETLSETTKAFLRELYIEEVFGRRKDIESKYMEKGNFAEEDSLSLVTRQLGTLYIKNKETLEDDSIIGTPDIRKPELIDVKTCWDIFSFASKLAIDPDYYWQLTGYMKLDKKEKSKLIYTLVDTPSHLIYNEIQRQAYKLGVTDTTTDYDALSKEIETNMKYEDIPEKLRFKVFEIEYKEEDYQKLLFRIFEARNYLNSLSGL